MKTEEDEAFDEIARKQGNWGGGFMAKRAMAADKVLDLDGHVVGKVRKPKREWVGLTDEEREQHRNDWHSNIHDKEFYAIEAKLKEKNFD